MGASVTGEPTELLDEDRWYSLASAVADGTCVLMLGPHAVTGSLGGERLPAHVALATFIKDQIPAETRDRIGPAFSRLDPKKPASVAQVLLREIDPPVLRRWVERFHAEFVVDEAPLVDLAGLPFEFVIDTSPIRTASDVFQRIKPGTVTAYYDRTGRQPAMLPDPTRDQPVVYQLYGSLEQPRSMILSDSDRLDFIVKVARGQPALPLNLSSALQDSDRSFLFLGFDLADWHYRLLLHLLSDNTRRNYTSFAAELDAAPLDAETADFYRTNHRVHFFDGRLSEFCSQLRDRCQVDQPSGVDSNGGVETSTPTHAGAPTVFVCHANEDAEYARDISDGLRSAGINTWLDKQNLRGGDDWNDEIEKMIRRDVDYVVVLQSQAMKLKDVGYVNREINLALDRQRDYRPPRTFLIPAFIDHPDNKLDLLGMERLQSVDATPTSGVTDLVRSIMRDLTMQARLG